MQEEVEMPRINILSTNDSVGFCKAAIICEEINCQFGVIMASLGYKQVGILDFDENLKNICKENVKWKMIKL